jgi:hypothetical protein
MSKFLEILLKVDKDVNKALAIAVAAKPLLSLTPVGAEVANVAEAILALEAKLGLPTN